MHDYCRISKALEYIKEHMQDQPSLNDIAESVHISPFHFQRLFTDWAGVSPKKFLQYLSLEHAKKILKQQNGTVYDATYETGLSSTGRLHDLFVTIEGMTPGEYKNLGRNLTIQYSLKECRFGNYLVASTSVGICNLLFFEKSAVEVENEFKSLWPNARIVGGEDEHHGAVQNFFENKYIDKDKLRLHLNGTPFQLKVWESILRIPEGCLTSYGNIAGAVNQPTAYRATGAAIGSNPVGYIIPCHRVIKSIGGIGEYRWGAARKMAMIGWEAAQLTV